MEHLVNLGQLSPNPVQLGQLPSGTNNPGDTERSESKEGEELKPLSTAPRAAPHLMEGSNTISDLPVINRRSRTCTDR